MDKRGHLYPKHLNWELVERRPTWSTVTSRELSAVFGVHLQTINNWALRGHLPPREHHKNLSGNKNHYRISTIRAWLENRPEIEIHWEWIRQHLGNDFTTLWQAAEICNVAFDVFNVERSSIPPNFTV